MASKTGIEDSSKNAAAAAAAAPPSAKVEEAGGGVSLLGLVVLDVGSAAGGLVVFEVVLVVELVLLPVDEVEEALEVVGVGFFVAPAEAPDGVALLARVVRGVLVLGCLGSGLFAGFLNSESFEDLSGGSLM